jgi:hypothetical protein
LEEEKYGPYYYFHFNYFSESHHDQDEQYFNYVTDIVINRIDHYKKKDPFSNLTKRHHWSFIPPVCPRPLNHCVQGNPNDRSREPV